MSRLSAVQTNEATGKAKELLEVVQAKLKFAPNMNRVMANSPAVLETFRGASRLHRSELHGSYRERPRRRGICDRPAGQYVSDCPQRTGSPVSWRAALPQQTIPAFELFGNTKAV